MVVCDIIVEWLKKSVEVDSIIKIYSFLHTRRIEGPIGLFKWAVDGLKLVYVIDIFLDVTW